MNGAPDTTRTYHYPDATKPRPHALSALDTEINGETTTESFDYDAAGNMTARPGAGDADQALTWGAEGKLTSTVQSGQVTSAVYDADGNRLLRREPTATTLYLPGTELRLNHASRAVTATRYHDLGNGATAMRTKAGVLAGL